jgi:hypothetical protein
MCRSCSVERPTAQGANPALCATHSEPILQRVGIGDRLEVRAKVMLRLSRIRELATVRSINRALNGDSPDVPGSW